MSKWLRKLRNNPKKTIFFGSITAWGVSYARERSREKETAKAFCTRATVFGEELLAVPDRPRTIAVLLNPFADDGHCQAAYDKWAHPVLNVAGLRVNVVRTQSPAQTKALARCLEPKDFECLDAVVVAGGDGSVSEAVTGFLTRDDDAQPAPLVVLPLGRRNGFVSNLLSRWTFNPSLGETSDYVARIALSAMAVLTGREKSVDVMRVEDFHGGQNVQPVYLLSQVRIGAFQDVETAARKLWWWGPIRRHWTYFKTALWGRYGTVRVKVDYREPCPGCQACLDIGRKRKKPEVSSIPDDQSGGTWWQRWRSPVVVRAESDPSAGADFDVDTNSSTYDDEDSQDCDLPWRSLDLDVADLIVRVDPEESCLTLEYLPGSLSPWDFFYMGSRFGHDDSIEQTLPRTRIRVGKITVAPSVELVPDPNDESAPLVEKETFYYFDGEKYVVKPVTASLLPKRVSMLVPS